MVYLSEKDHEKLVAGSVSAVIESCWIVEADEILQVRLEHG
jgi:hypothetical protein